MNTLSGTLLLATLLSSAAVAAPAEEPAPGHPIALPVEVREHRFFLRPRLASGQTLTLYSDSGGGHTMLSPAVATANRLATTAEHTPEGDFVSSADWLKFAPGAGIPRPAGKLLVRELSELMPGLDGFLGQDWFGGRTWTFDYLGKRLFWRATGDLPPGTRTPIHLNPDRDAPRFGRIQITIDGQALDVLFDTGATTRLTPAAVGTLGKDAAAERAASFMKAAVFDRWRARHPEWKVLAAAEQRSSADMIEVPSVTVAGQTVGPVWFTRRPDKAFDEFMSSLMDAPVVGAFGGSGLRYFRVTVDFAAGEAVFER
jgi:hypothetical protein